MTPMERMPDAARESESQAHDAEARVAWDRGDAAIAAAADRAAMAFLAASLESADPAATAVASERNGIQSMREALDALSAQELDVPIHGVAFPDAEQGAEIGWEHLTVVHCTDHFPLVEGDALRVPTTAAATGDPKKPRHTVHFTLNHPVTRHAFGDWSERSYAIVAPASGVVAGNGAPTALRSVDTFWQGNGVRLPEGTVILAREDAPIPKHVPPGVRVIRVRGALHIWVDAVIAREGYSAPALRGAQLTSEEFDGPVEALARREGISTVLHLEHWTRKYETAASTLRFERGEYDVVAELAAIYNSLPPELRATACDRMKRVLTMTHREYVHRLDMNGVPAIDRAHRDLVAFFNEHPEEFERWTDDDLLGLLAPLMHPSEEEGASARQSAVGAAIVAGADRLPPRIRERLTEIVAMRWTAPRDAPLVAFLQDTFTRAA